MDPKELQSKYDSVIAEKALIAEKAAAADARAKALETELKSVTFENATLKSEKDALTKEHTKACTDRDEATKRADEAEGKLIELEVGTLIGVKIAPTEKDDFVALRKSSPTLFASMIEKRPDMKLTTQVTKTDAAVSTTNGASLTSTDDTF